MTEQVPSPILLDDNDLLRVVATPRKRLYPRPKSLSIFTPLILVCALFPTLLLLTNFPLSEADSSWALRSLAVANASSVTEFLQPESSDSDQPLRFQPPLAPWLNGIVIRLLGTSRFLSLSLVSLVASSLTIVLSARCGWRIGGANLALIAAVLMCSHPQLLAAALSPANNALGTCLLLAAVVGFQRHLERGTSLISLSLILSGLAWGLSLLAIGPIAGLLLPVFAVHAWRSLPQFATAISTAIPESGPLPRTRREVFQATLILAITGLLVGGWWEVMLLLQSGSAFRLSWLSLLPLECLVKQSADEQAAICSEFQPRSWEGLVQSSLLIGWLVVGWWRAWRLSQDSTEENSRRRFQLLWWWWSLTFAGRILADIAGTLIPTNTAAWNVALIAPTVLLAALGVHSLIERTVSGWVESLLVIAAIGVSLGKITGSIQAGLIGAALASLLLVYGPSNIPFRDAGTSCWTESIWRRLLKLTITGSMITALVLGIAKQDSVSDENRFAELRTRLEQVPNVRRISLVGSRDPVPAALRYLLRCRWPQAQIIMDENWDAGLTEAMEAEEMKPQSRFLVLQRTRRELRLSANTGQAWKVSAVGNPLCFNEKRLSFVLIEPKGAIE